MVFWNRRADDVAHHSDGALQLQLGIAAQQPGRGTKFRHGLAALQDDHTLAGCPDAVEYGEAAGFEIRSVDVFHS